MEKAKEEYSIERDWFGLGLFCSFKNKLLINDYVFRYFALIFCSFYKRKKKIIFPTRFAESVPKNKIFILN